MAPIFLPLDGWIAVETRWSWKT